MNDLYFFNGFCYFLQALAVFQELHETCIYSLIVFAIFFRLLQHLKSYTKHARLCFQETKKRSKVIIFSLFQSNAKYKNFINVIVYNVYKMYFYAHILGPATTQREIGALVGGCVLNSLK